MQGMTHRESLARFEWLEEQWNRPGRLEEYIIQLTEVVHGIIGRRTNRNRFKIKFLRAGEIPETPKTEGLTQAELSKAAWKLRMTPPAKTEG